MSPSTHPLQDRTSFAQISPLSELPSLTEHASVVEIWSLASGGPEVTLYEGSGRCWIYCKDYGAVGFCLGQKDRSLHWYKSELASDAAFYLIASHYWLPLIYNGWGHLVLHASAVCHQDSGAIFLFVGSSGSGKSTWAYGLGQQTGWLQLSDDAFALEIQDSQISPIYLPGSSRLRPQSAAHFQAHPTQELDPWPKKPLSIKGLYTLSPSATAPNPLQFAPKTPAETCTHLLSQAFVLHLKWPSIRRALLRQVLCLTKNVPCFAFAYQPSFARFPDALEDVTEHALSLSGD